MHVAASVNKGSHPALAALGLKVRYQEIAQPLQTPLPAQSCHTIPARDQGA